MPPDDAIESAPATDEQTARPPTVAPPPSSSPGGPLSSPPLSSPHRSLLGGAARAITPIPRREERRQDGDGRDPPARRAGLRARASAARARGDLEAAAQAEARLARALVEGESDLEEATSAGRRALAVRTHDADLRTLVASTLEGLGEYGLSAATLRPAVDDACARASRGQESADEAVSGLLRLGDLHLRSGDIEGALESYRYVTVIAQERPEGQERIAFAHATAPEAVPAEVAARAFLGAAKKRQLGGDEVGAMEALGRAFEVHPRGNLPASVLSDTLEDVGRLDAADAVRAEHASAQSTRAEAATVHAARLDKASVSGDRAARLAAEVDLVVDLVLHEPELHRRLEPLAELPFDVLLGLTRAARRAHALVASGTTALSALAESCSGHERVEILAEIVARDPADERALGALREHARLRRDPHSVVDALVRGLRGAPLDAPLLASRAAELSGWADEQIDEPNIAAWAWRKLLERVPDDRRARDELGRLQARVAKASQRQEDARNRATSDDATTRAEALASLADILLSRPDRAADAVDVLVAAVRADPARSAPLVPRAAARLLPAEAEVVVSAACDTQLRSAAAPLRIELLLRRSDLRGAFEVAQSSEAGLSVDLALAVLAGQLPDLGRALERYAPSITAPRERATLLAGAARAFRCAGAFADARRAAESALRAEPRDARGAFELAELAAHPAVDESVLPPSVAAPALERALGLVGARARWSLSLAMLAERTHDATLASAWTRRAWALRPGDPVIAAVWLRRAVALGDADLCAEVIDTVARGVARLGSIAEPLGQTLAALRGLPDGADHYDRAARTLLTLGCARLAPVLAELRGAHAHPCGWPGGLGARGARLAIAALERWLASAAPASERGPTLLEIANIALQIGDAAGTARAVEAFGRVLSESDAPAAAHAEARGQLLAREGLDLGGATADAELVVRGLLADTLVDHAVKANGILLRGRVESAEEHHAAADALREFGRALWDLAEDSDAARRAWLRGARLLGAEGLDRLEADLSFFGGDAQVRDAIYELRQGVFPDDDRLPGTTLQRVHDTELTLRAFERTVARPPDWVEPLSLAREAVAHAPDPAAVLPAVEALVRKISRIDALPDIYELAAGRSTGRFAERGVRHHAARVLERLGMPAEALHHAIRAFAALPSEGSTLRSLERLAVAAQRPDLATQALVDAADQALDAERKATFLDHAVAIGREAAPEERLDLLLRLFLIAPSPKTVHAIADAIRQVSTHDEGLRETETDRLLRAHKKVDNKLGYTDRLPVLSAVARAVASLRGVGPALDMLAKGAKSTPRGDLDPLREAAEELARKAPDGARAWLVATPESDGGVLRAHVAWASGDADLALQLLVTHAPEDDDLDFAGESGADRDAALVESWSTNARDHRVVARAWERFGRRQGAAAELEAARALHGTDQNAEAAEALLRAFAIREGEPDELVQQIVDLAREVLPVAGKDPALAALLADDVPRHGDDHPEVAARWREIAAVRARIADFVGVLDALFEAGRCAPADEDLWQEIADAAEAVGAHDRLAAALSQRLSRARPDRRVLLLRKLARVLEHDLGRDGEAAERWAELVRLLPMDTEAGDALERIAERRGGGPELVDLLRARASRLPAGHPDRVRVLRRLSRELSGHPARRGEVLAALREVHHHNPSDVEVAAQLATLARAAGDVGTAAEALMRAFRGTEPGAARVWLAIEAARVLLELSDLDTAARILHEAAGEVATDDPRVLDLARLQLEVSVARADAREEAVARMRLARLDLEAPPAGRAAHALAAARILSGVGELAEARALAWDAARLTPGEPAATAFLCELLLGHEHGPPAAGGASEPFDSALLAAVSAVSATATAPAEVAAIIAFARAELLDAQRGGGAGYQDLHAWPDHVRAQPLVQLALAERLAAEWSYAAATAAYERAFAGDLHGMRATGPAALRAADAAARSNDLAKARTFLDLAARDPDCRIDARRRAVDLARAADDREGALRALERLAAEASGNVRAEALAEQALLVGSTDAEAALEVMRLAVQAADGALRERLASELRRLESHDPQAVPKEPPPSLRDSGVRSSLPLERALATASAEPAPAVIPAISPAEDVPSGPLDGAPARKADPSATAEAAADRADPAIPPARRASPVPPRPPADPVAPNAGPAVRASASITSRSFPALPAVSGAAPLDRAGLGKLALDPAARNDERVQAFGLLASAAEAAGEPEQAIRDHLSALELGDIDAGDRVADLLVSLPDRAADVLLVRRRQAFLEPGVPRHLDALHLAALGARDHVLARAIDHVRRAFDPAAGPVPPPALEIQIDRPELLLPLLERRAVPAAAEALRIAWEHGSASLKRDPGLSGARGMDRVTTALPIGRVAAAAAHLLGLRTAVYLRQRPGLDVEVFLVPPPYVVLGADAREDTPETRYLLGAGLMASLPSHCLLLAQPEGGARATYQALLSAFGPPEHGRSISAEVGRLAAALWQSVPRAAQRRLGELLGNNPPAFEAVIDGARQVARRGGLYLSGDLGATLRKTLAETHDPAVLDGASGLAEACREHPAVADLVRLATSPEFAETRWRMPTTGGTSGQRRP